MKKWGLAVFLFTILIISFFSIRSIFLKKHTQTSKEASFFLPVPISEFTSLGIPLLNIEIGNKTYIASIDLGFTGYLAMKNEFIQDIPEKSFISNSTTYGFMGNKYQENVYEIPKIKIDKATFHQILVNEEAPTFHVDSTILKEGDKLAEPPQGRLGLKLFRKSNLFLDLGNSKIIFCDSIETLKNNGYSMDDFAKAPLLLDRGLLEIESRTSNGSLRCLLDTGFSCNALHTESQQGESQEEMVLNPEYTTKISSFVIDEKDFGSVTFRNFPIKLPIKVEAVLGMEFFSKHQVFLDYANKQVYIAPSTKKN